MKTYFSDCEKHKCVKCKKGCPYNCCSCYIIECCYENCPFRIKEEQQPKNLNLLRNATYSLATSTTNNNTEKYTPYKHIEKTYNVESSKNNDNSRENKNLNTNTNKIDTKNNSNYSMYNDSKLRSKRLLDLNDDLIDQTKNLTCEINKLKERLKSEKENLSKVLNNDYEIISQRINLKKNNFNKNLNYDYERKFEPYNLDNNSHNIIKDEIKKINIPKRVENTIRNNYYNNILNDEDNINKYINNKSYNIDTNNNNKNHNSNLYVNDKDDNYNINESNNNYNKSDIMNKRRQSINLKSSSFKSPTLYDREKYKKLKHFYYPINNTETSLLNSKIRNSPIKFKNNYNYNDLNSQKRHEQILKPNIKYIQTERYDKQYPKYNSFLTEKPNIRTKHFTRPLIEKMYTANYSHKIRKVKPKLPICFNDNSELNLPRTTTNEIYSHSYKNMRRKINKRIFPLHKFRSMYKHIRDFNDKIEKKYLPKYSQENGNVRRIGNIPILYKRSYFRNEILDKDKNNILLKSKSNYELYNGSNLLKSLHENNIASNDYSNHSKNNDFSVLNSSRTKRIELCKNKLNNFYNKKSMKYNPHLISNNDYRLYTDKNNYKISRKFFSINKPNINNNKNIYLNNNKNNISSKPLIKMNNLSHSNKVNDHYNNSQYEKLKKNLIDIENNNINEETLNSLSKYYINTDLNINKPEENSQIKDFNIIKDKKPNVIPKVNTSVNLSFNSEMNYLKLSKNIEISSQTIFTLYIFLNKIYILCFDFKNRKFSLRDFSDNDDFDKNFKLSLKSKTHTNTFNKLGPNLFLSKNPYLYIITGKNCDILYVYDSNKKSIYKLCKLKNNHSNGSLIDFYFNNNSLLCISGDFNKKVELYSISKNGWNNYLSETLIERSNCSYCILKKRYIFLIFGKNYPTNEYLNTIEFYDLNFNKNNKLSGWKYLNYKNKNNLIKMNICNGCGINYNDKKIILFGGYNGLENKDEEYFTQIIFNKSNSENNSNGVVIERTNRKFKDIDKNKKYYFNGGKTFIKNDKNNQNDIVPFFSCFDNKFNCHIIQISNLAHDVYYNK